MKVVVPHRRTVEEAIVIVDRSANELFSNGAGQTFRLFDQKKRWNGPLMNFSLIARVGFLSLPVSGRVLIDDVNVTVHCELPPLVKVFAGEDKIRAGVERQVRGMLRG